MANFENVKYEYYSETLGRAVIPSEADFNNLKLLNIQLMKSWLPYIEENEENGIDKAVCLMMEVDYQDSQLIGGESGESIASESVGGHSISFGSSAQNKAVELNAKKTIDKKIEMAKYFCTFAIGVR